MIQEGSVTEKLSGYTSGVITKRRLSIINKSAAPSLKMKSPPNHKSNVWLTSKMQRDTKLKEQLLDGRRRKRESKK